MTVLAVLKIIGIVLLVILGVLLLLVLLILFVPVRYRVDAGLPEPADGSAENEKFPPSGTNAKLRFSWLLHLINGGYLYPDRKEFFLRIALFTLVPKRKKADQEESSGSPEPEHADTEADTDSDKPGSEEEKTEKEETEIEETGKAGSEKEENEEEETEKEEPGKEENGKEETEREETEKEDTGKEQPKKKDTGKKSETGETTDEQQVGLEKICYTISAVCDKIEKVRSTVENPIFERALDLTLRELRMVLKHILPVKVSGKAVIGAGEPAATAEIFAAYGVMYPVIGSRMRIIPDFERKIAAGDLHIKGRIRLIVIVWAAARLFFNRDVKKTVRRFKQIAG